MAEDETDSNFKQPTFRRHCERSEAIQNTYGDTLDCFVAALLAMTSFGVPAAGFARVVH
jgi:hypothetical protein